MLKFILNIVTLVVGSTLFSVMYEMIAGNRSFSLPFGNILLATLIGAVMFLFGGWVSTVAVLGLYGVYCLIGAFADRSGGQGEPEH